MDMGAEEMAGKSSCLSSEDLSWTPGTWYAVVHICMHLYGKMRIGDRIIYGKLTSQLAWSMLCRK